jgi:hypothetical protein
MSAKSEATVAVRTLLTFVVLLFCAVALGAVVLRPGKASLWPGRAEEWLSPARGPISLDVPPAASAVGTAAPSP